MLGSLGQNPVEIGPGQLRWKAPQEIIAAQRHDHGIHIVCQRPVHARKPARGCVTRNACIAHNSTCIGLVQPGLQLRHKSLILGEAVPLGQTVTQSGDHDAPLRILCGSARRQQRKAESPDHGRCHLGRAFYNPISKVTPVSLPIHMDSPHDCFPD